MRCYRYMPFEYCVQTILSGRFKVAKPSDFNDPFDCIGNVCGVPPQNVLRKFAATLDAAHEHSVDEVADWLGRDFDLKLAKAVQDRASIGQLFRVLCMSDADETDHNSETLMWAHYADKGRGVRILLDLDPDGLPIGCSYEKITYSPDGRVPILPLSTLTDFPKSPELSRFYAQCIVTKGQSWQYEKEVRMVIGPDALSQLTIKNAVELFPLPRAFIRGLEFGSEVSEAQISHAIDTLSQSGYALQYRWAKFSGEMYQYDYWCWDTARRRWFREEDMNGAAG